MIRVRDTLARLIDAAEIEELIVVQKCERKMFQISHTTYSLRILLNATDRVRGAFHVQSITV